MKRVFLVMACALVLTGCAKPVWDKYQANKQDYAVDHEACWKDAQQHGYVGENLLGDGVFSEVSWPSQYRECMTLKGWYQETQIWSFVSDMGQ